MVDKFSKSRSVDAIFTSGSWVRFIMIMVGEESAKCIKRRWAVTPWKTCKPLIDVLYWVFLGTVLLHAYILMISLLLQWFFNQWECMTIWFMSFFNFPCIGSSSCCCCSSSCSCYCIITSSSEANSPIKFWRIELNIWEQTSWSSSRGAGGRLLWRGFSHLLLSLLVLIWAWLCLQQYFCSLILYGSYMTFFFNRTWFIGAKGTNACFNMGLLLL